MVNPIKGGLLASKRSNPRTQPMGDSRRFDEFAALIARNFPDREARIADVAGGKGYLRAALYRLGYRSVETWDKCKANRRQHRPGYRFALFDYRSAPDYDLVVGMHPDGGTDHIIRYAVERRVPFAVCPCCVVPSAAPTAAANYGSWLHHLYKLARSPSHDVFGTDLRISGRKHVILGRALLQKDGGK